MIIDKNTHIQDFKLFEEQDGHLIPAVYTDTEGGNWKDWSDFVLGTTVHSIVLHDGTEWDEINGIRPNTDREFRRRNIARIFPHLAELMGVAVGQVKEQTPAADLTAPTKAAKQKRLAAARKKTQ